jgi:putative FmdB family regulatory protein
MPTYVYRRDDGTTFEMQQKITDDPLEECPETGQPVERVITSSPGVILDSSGPSSDDASRSPSCSGPLCGL